MPIQFTIFNAEDGFAAVSVFADGQLLSADDSHPNFRNIVAACEESKTNLFVTGGDVIPLFDIAATVERKFARLSERVAVKDGIITLDGDPVHGTLQNQILDFVDAGEDFDPLVNFYERLTTNPLGDVREGLFSWIQGEGGEHSGKATITPEGKLLGYKSVALARPEWRTDFEEVYIPSRRGEGVVNGIDVNRDQFIEQVVGDVVEMPRSRVLNAPSVACGDGLHIGTWEYASTFYGGSVVMLVEFDPRDIVSLPDRNSVWKLRVCRYKIIDIVTEPVDVPAYQVAKNDLDLTIPQVPEVGIEEEETPEFERGDFVIIYDDAVVANLDHQGEKVEVLDPADGDGDLWVYHEDTAAEFYVSQDHVMAATEPKDDGDVDLAIGDSVMDEDGDEGVVTAIDTEGLLTIDYEGNTSGSGFTGVYGEWAPSDVQVTKRNGYSGPTSQAAKGRGRNAAQNDKGQFANGRPGSKRDASTGRFA